jgi:hypothetical protein
MGDGTGTFSGSLVDVGFCHVAEVLVVSGQRVGSSVSFSS